MVLVAALALLGSALVLYAIFLGMYGNYYVNVAVAFLGYGLVLGAALRLGFILGARAK